MHIGFITQWYPPENVWMPQAVVEGLRAEGHRVTVLTGIPHYPSGTVPPGYSAWRGRLEAIDGVTVRRVPEYPYRGSGILGRFAGYGSFAATASVAALTRLRDCDVLLVYGSPATAALPAMAVRMIRRMPYVLQVQDIWPDTVLGTGFVRSSILARTIGGLLGALVTASYAMASEIVAITPSARDLLGNRRGATGKVSLIYNWLPEAADSLPYTGSGEQPASHVAGLRERIGASPEDFVFLYAGAMGPSQNLSAIVDAFQQADVDAHLVLIGTGVEREHLMAQVRSGRRTHILAPAPQAEATELSRQADVCVVSLSDSRLHRATFPSKIQALCRLGRPILVSAPGDAARYIADNGAGRCADPADTASIIAAFRGLAGESSATLHQLAERARSCYHKDFSPSVGAAALSRLLTQAAGRVRRKNPRTPS